MIVDARFSSPITLAEKSAWTISLYRNVEVHRCTSALAGTRNRLHQGSRPFDRSNPASVREDSDRANCLVFFPFPDGLYPIHSECQQIVPRSKVCINHFYRSPVAGIGSLRHVPWCLSGYQACCHDQHAHWQTPFFAVLFYHPLCHSFLKVCKFTARVQGRMYTAQHSRPRRVTVHSRCYAMNIVSVLYVEASQNRFGHVVSSVIITLASAASLVALFPPLGPSTVTPYLRADPLFVALVRLSASTLESNDSSSESLL